MPPSPARTTYLREKERRLAEEVAGWLKATEALDIAEDERYGEDDGSELPKWMKNKRERLAKIREAKAALEKEASATSSRSPAGSLHLAGRARSGPLGRMRGRAASEGGDLP